MDRHEPNRAPLWVGLIGTAVWLVAFSSYAVYASEKIWTLEPNALGDFLAGAFAPLAFLWIVVGYMMQAAELRLQVQELTSQVEATQDMARAALGQGRREIIEGQPFFIASVRLRPGTTTKSLQLRNTGERATDVLVGEVLGERLALMTDGWRLSTFGHETSALEILSDGPGWIRFDYLDRHHGTQSAWIYYDGGDLCLTREFGLGPVEDDDMSEWLLSRTGEFYVG